ncbi:uncharacterized protein LOC132759630 [Ruditapes philippinarum]|uniref:uncharacterized protein LOC132759630 n=1 Tax=Ruditapes philippinarum TaxID=129788 RepID=UPI00295B23EF|nr:uncharacterized protein LOC132759630 [Ruditapes philippinarum]
MCMRSDNFTGNVYNRRNSFPRVRDILFAGPGSNFLEEKAFIREEKLLTVPKLKAKSNNDIGVRIDRMQDVAGDSPVYRNNMFDDIIPTSKKEIILRIKAEMKAEANYHLLTNNCQHSCTKIKYGIPFSRQADISGWNAYENKRVQVALVGDLKPKSNHMINKFVHQERFECSDKGKSDENDFHYMIYNRTKTGFHDFSDLYVSTFVRETQIRSEIQQCIQNNTPNTDYSNITLTSQLSECKIFNIVPCRTRLSGSGSQLLYSMEYKYDNDTSYTEPCRTRLSSSGSQLLNSTECKYDYATSNTELYQTRLSDFEIRLHNSTPSSDSNVSEGYMPSTLVSAISVIILGSLGMCIIIRHWYKSRERMSNSNSAVSTIEPIHDGSN